jgi:arginine decarboxylase
MIITLPTSYFLVAGYAEGPTALNAFDNALMKAGVGNTNLVRMSSILPPAAKEIPLIQLPFGALVPIAYAEETGEEHGTMVSAAVALGIPDDGTLPGVIMEHHMRGEESACREIVIEKVNAAFASRGYRMAEVKLKSAAGIVKGIGTAFAGVVLWT